jgi:hypothetical protein
MADPEVTCTYCGTAITDPAAIKARWCGFCRSFRYGLVEEEPIRFSEIIADLHKSTLHYAINRPPTEHFAVGFEQFTHPGVTYTAWRCFLKVDGKVGRTSMRPHLTPGDALRELYELVKAS